MLKAITIPQDKIIQFCHKHHVRKLALFGSVLHNHFRAESDIDVLVEFEPEHIPGWEFVTMQDELSEIFARKVDLNTAGFLSSTFRDEVLREAVVIYEQDR